MDPYDQLLRNMSLENYGGDENNNNNNNNHHSNPPEQPSFNMNDNPSIILNQSENDNSNGDLNDFVRGANSGDDNKGAGGNNGGASQGQRVRGSDDLQDLHSLRQLGASLVSQPSAGADSIDVGDRKYEAVGSVNASTADPDHSSVGGDNNGLTRQSMREIEISGVAEKDIDEVNETLTHHYGLLREAINEKLHSMKKNMIVRHQEEIANVTIASEESNNSLQDKIERLKEEIYELKMDNNDLVLQQGKFLKAWSNKQNQLVSIQRAGVLFRRWKANVQRIKNDRETNRLWVRRYHQNRMMAQVLSSWRTVARAERKKKETMLWKKQMKDITTKLVNKYEKSLADLRSELAATLLQIRHKNEDQTFVEEKMKQAFMRGICALNREAMVLFNDTGSVSSDIHRYNMKTQQAANPSPSPSQSPFITDPAQFTQAAHTQAAHTQAQVSHNTSLSGDEVKYNTSPSQPRSSDPLSLSQSMPKPRMNPPTPLRM